MILGEPGSGKTFQLKHYKELNKNDVEFVELIGINDIEEIKSTTEIVLIDSIDEALLEVTSKKILKRKLSKYIEKCKRINLEVKFIITCRFLEWKEVFETELKNIDDSLKILEIKDLSKGDINKIIDFKEKNKEEFWKFIEENYLLILLKNILMVESLVLNYEEYRDKKLKYTDIYQEIIKNHISIETDNERKKIVKTIPLEKLIKIASSVACYMSLNRKNSLLGLNLSILADEIYKSKDYEVKAEDLEVLFDTGLFVEKNGEFKFFHKSTQEYLTAKFIVDKKLNIGKIKEVFAHKGGFYERFEEIIIYLTNIEPQFFRHFIEFAPFIFRRHSNLNKEEQRQLFIAIIKKLKIDGQELWENWRNVRGTTLVKFDKVNDLFEYLEGIIEKNQVNRELFLYLEKVLDENYSEELENYLLEVLEYRNKNKQDINEYLNDSWSENKSYNEKLLGFIKRNELFNINHESLYLRIFKMLYKYIELKDLKILIEYISEYRKTEVIEILDRNDIKEWIEDAIENYKDDSDRLLELLIYKLLSEYKRSEKETLEKVLKFVSRENRFHIFTSYYNRKKLNFNLIRSDFFDCYFKPLEDKEYLFNRNKVLTFYSIRLEDIQKISKKYPIKDCKEYYYSLSRNDEIKEFLLKDMNYKKWFNEKCKKTKEEIKAEKEHQKYREKELMEIKRKKEKYKESIKELKAFEDILVIFREIYEEIEYEKEKLKERLLKDLGDRYKLFLEIVENQFKIDTLYMEYRKEKLKNCFNEKSIIYSYLFSNLSTEKVKNIIKTEEEYEKLFWHTLKEGSLNEKYFIEISKDYKEVLLKLSVEIYKEMVVQVENKGFRTVWRLNKLYLDLNMVENKGLEKLFEALKNGMNENYKTMIKEFKISILDILIVDVKNYNYILELSNKDVKNYELYYEYLMKLDINKGIDDFLKFKCKRKDIKKEEFEELILLIPSFDEEAIYCNRLKDEKIKFILERHFELCKEYDLGNVNNYSQAKQRHYFSVRKLKSSLENNLEREGLLREMSKSKMEGLSKFAKHYLKKLENLRIENGVYPPQYYKELFDNYKPTEKIFFDYEKLDKDLKEISYMLMDSRQSISREKEDLINIRFRDFLRIKKYDIGDQSQGGESESGKSLGERDLIIRNKETNITECVLEAFRLENLDRAVIDKHYQKLIKKYDVHGNKKNIVLVYVMTKQFESLWEKYSFHFPNLKKIENEKQNLKIGITKEENMEVIHYFINFYSE